ncbi:MAG: peptidylprolyl isomerase [Chitinophagales bacterium]
MMKKFGLIFFALFNIAFAAKRMMPQPIFAIDGVPVSTEEFVRVYTKNNINGQADFSRESLEEYLQLYVNFKLKVKEAEALELDKDEAISAELASYRKQLSKTYLSDKEATETLLREAYDRSLYEVDASHILIGWPNANPTTVDSAAVLKEINKIKKKASYTDFAQLAKEYSDDPSAVDNGGHLGYLSVFQTVYPFESAMYNTDVDKVSDPVATRFGYHIVLVHDKRDARGKMKTAHILIKSKTSDDEATQVAAQEEAARVYASLMDETMTFENAVKTYSDDNKTKYNNGELPELSGAEMLTSFADAAFALENDGDISSPVKTSIGWHIIKRISKSTQKSYNEMENTLKTRIERDSRSNVAKEKTITDTKDYFGFKENKENLESLLDLMVEHYGATQYVIEDKTPYENTLFSISTQVYTQADFLMYVEIYQKRNTKAEAAAFEKMYYAYRDQMIMDFREKNLADIDEDFKNLMQEYHDGILLFELTDDKVWTKAVEDTTGLKTYHEAHKKDYMWDNRIDYTTYTTTSEKANAKVKKLVSKGKDMNFILSKLNKKEEVLVTVNGKHEKGTNTFADEELQWEKGFSLEKREGDKIHYTYVNKIRDPEPKELHETRGYVISDYQAQLEKEWLEELNGKYKVEINKYVLESLIKE